MDTNRYLSQLTSLAWLVVVLIVASCTSQERNATDKSSTPTKITAVTAIPAATATSLITATLPPSVISSSPTPATLLLGGLAKGQYILYSAESQSVSGYSLYLTSLESNSLHRLVIEDFQGGSLSPNGQYMGFVDGGFVWLLSLQEDIVAAVPNSDGCNGSNPIWSQDNNYMLLLCGNNFDISIVSLADGARSILVTDLEKNLNGDGFSDLNLSQDGRFLAYYGWHKSGENRLRGLFVTELHCLTTAQFCGGQTHMLMRPDLPSPMAWSPENRLAVANYSSIEIYEVSTDAPLQSLKTELDSRINSITWSPDGSQIVFTQSYALYVMMIEERQIHKLSADAEFVGSVIAWLEVP